MTAVNCIGVKQTAKLVKLFTALKLILIGALFIAGMVYVNGHESIVE